VNAEDHPQMDPSEATTPDLALAYMLQTHLCYSHIHPGELPFRVLRQRLASVGHRLVSEAELATALERYALEGDDLDDDERYGPVIAISLPTGHPNELAHAIFAALVAAQEKGEGVTPPSADALQGGGT